jgi:hypothetical protein
MGQLGIDGKGESAPTFFGSDLQYLIMEDLLIVKKS